MNAGRFDGRRSHYRPVHPRACGEQFCEARGAEVEAAAKSSASQVEMCPVLIGKRMAFVRASVKGLAVQEYERNPGLYSNGKVRWADGKASEEVRRLYEYTCIQL